MSVEIYTPYYALLDIVVVVVVAVWVLSGRGGGGGGDWVVFSAFFCLRFLDLGVSAFCHFLGI